MSERTLICPDCGLKFSSRRSDGSRTHCYRCVPPMSTEGSQRGTPCERCGRPSRNARCSRCRLIVPCSCGCGVEAQLSSRDYGKPDASARAHKCLTRTTPRGVLGAFSCAHCGERVERKRNGSNDRLRFCSRECSRGYAKAAAQPQRIKGECEVCGAEFYRKASDFNRRDGNKGGRFCSKRCQGVHISREAAKCRAADPKPPKSPRSRVYFRECKICQRLFCARNARTTFCSAQCKIDDSGLRVKGLYAAATQFIDGRYVGGQWRKVLLQYLVDRDGDRCGICNRPVDITLKSGTRGSRRGPSVDHIVPRSLGGTDDLSNLRLAHWGCNQKRGNRAKNEQLALVG